MFFVQQLVNGIAVGSIYSLIAIGFSLVYGILRMMNFAHGDVFAFSTILIASLLQDGMPSVPAIAIGIVVGAGLASIVEFVCYRPLRSAPRSISMITALGAAFVLRNASEYIWGFKPTPFPALFGTRVYKLGGLRFPAVQLASLAVAGVTLLIFGLFLRRTRPGKAIQLIAQDVPTASLMGVRVNVAVVMVYAIGGALGVVGGVLYGSVYSVAFPAMGFTATIKAFVASVIGGIGNLTGALVGGLLLGVIETLAVVYGSRVGFSPGYRDAVAFALLIVFLFVRPSGLFGTRVAAGERV